MNLPDEDAAARAAHATDDVDRDRSRHAHPEREWEERPIDPRGHIKVAAIFLLPLLALLAWGAFAA